MTDGRPSDVVALRIAIARKQKGWTQAQLADAMTKAGWPIDRTTIAKIEAGGSRRDNLTLNETLAFALVLGVGPVYLMVPWKDEFRVSLTKIHSLQAEYMRWWVSGEMYREWRPRPGATAKELAALKHLRADWRFFQYMRPGPKENDEKGS